ncbi:hypothetical protein P7B02_16190 [Caulobacter segnis]|uniref:hypothetical protein n=1 Tax=Caulobacter segnis TaxID=88688 RepID=UPI0024103300|nr:hypothetical protein [Caulobacter segnis]MDG2523076.1 hypothetical protein [Caulobacter segnis]
MHRAFPIAAALSGVLAVSACAPKPPAGVDAELLAQEIGNAIGSDSTCVLFARAGGSGQVVHRYGTHLTCGRTLPSCEGGSVTAADMLQRAAKGDVLSLSCDTRVEDARTVGWATGRVAQTGPARDLVYVAVMEGDRALPGREIRTRIEAAFRVAKL